MAKPFSLEKKIADGISTVTLKGFVDAHTAPDFAQALQDEVDAGRFRIIVDCEKLDYMSSAGLGVFMGFVEEVRDNGGDIKICNVIPKVAEVFELLSFDEIFDIFDDLSSAVGKFGTADTARES